jgi:hypothetical protein
MAAKIPPSIFTNLSPDHQAKLLEGAAALRRSARVLQRMNVVLAKTARK